MITVCIESPLAGDFRKNLEYARQCMAYVFAQGDQYAPFASHLLYPQVLDDRRDAHRARGIAAGTRFGNMCSERWFFVGLGMSKGMEQALEQANDNGQRVKIIALEFGKQSVSPTPADCPANAGHIETLDEIRRSLESAMQQGCDLEDVHACVLKLIREL